ncbi:methylamine utilization protein MauJ [Maridesulfovibrio frigidus]|uniref:methylamine utilization protein MauJ n=1 Tax=Maridesulfovibrio frigidus TaxID=340956 RepID=UPI0004E107D4|nr:methylamine utilization protein MauJ [Maridesulfovibrio frigidus]
MFSVIAFDSAAYLKQEEIRIPYGEYSLKIVREKIEREDEARNPRALSNQIIIKSHKEHQAHIAGRMFLSEFSWLFDVAIYDIMHTGGSIPIKGITDFVGHSRSRVPVDLESYSYSKKTDEQLLALGLYKEAISSNSIFFKYLGLFKILEIGMDGKQRSRWLKEYLVKKQYDDAEQLSIDMWRQGRCAVAHGKDSINVHTFHDYHRIEKFYFILKPAVRLYMENKLQIPTFKCSEEVYQI